MATGKHIRVVLLGKRTNAKFPNETWQTGQNFVEADSGGVFAGAIKESLPSFDVSIIGDSESDATWNIDWAWKGQTKLTKTNQRAIADTALSFYQALRAKLPTDSQLLGVKISAVDSLGKVIGGANYFTLVTPLSGTGTVGTQTPPQICVVCSTITGARGPSGRGRMYLPLNAIQPSSGTMGSSDRTLVVDSTADWFEAVRAVGPLAAVVNVGRQTYSSISSVQCGNMFDTQRRRRAQSAEEYTGSVVNL